MTPATTARPSADGWGREDSPETAIARLLDAAGAVFAEKGVTHARMGDVAAAAGCSRGTLYRYFPDRDQLRQAYVDREAARVGTQVLRRLDELDEPEDRLVAAIVAAVDAVRADPFLRAWFDPAAAATAGHFAMRGEVIAGLIAAFLTDLFTTAEAKGRLRVGVSHELAVEWVVRIVLSLLTEPAPAPSHERAMLDQLLVPALFSASP